MSREVTKEEFDAFIAAFPRPLTKDVTLICDPPLLRYCDFSEGKTWPEAQVASVSLRYEYTKGWHDFDVKQGKPVPTEIEPDRYYIEEPTTP